MTTKRIGYYVTGHGLGHATRSLGIIQALLSRKHIVHVISAIEPSFFYTSLNNHPCLSSHQRYLDTGAIQNGPLIVDPVETLNQFLTNVHNHRERIITDEIEFLRQNRFDIVITDATSIICRIAKDCSVPCVLLTNFTWNFCYEQMFNAIASQINQTQHLQYTAMVQACENDYADATLFIRLPGYTPLTESMERNINTITLGPMICRKAAKTAEEVRSELDISIDAYVVVLGFGGFKRSAEWQLLDDFLPRNWVCIVLGAAGEVFSSPRYVGISFDYFIPDVINAADAVIGKLGYGTMSECIAHGTPLLYVPRSSWPEEPYLEQFIVSHNAGIAISEAEFLAGIWGPYLAQALQLKGAWDPASLETNTANDRTVQLLIETGLL